ncbi:SufE family protein [Chitinibacter bivalviorum]|uniref:SufE family protein n=2 Tax=Chitinibacter bivalviorum TaxID=2739434 RepID=A0A7H9BN11_9NEIS|nr:SufE family protein [Chitinibacter bivalviorum]
MNNTLPIDQRFEHPFGTRYDSNEIAKLLDQAYGWEAKNRLLVQLAKQLPEWPDSDKTPKHKVSGCESQVWLALEPIGAHWQIAADSDSRIVKGLLALVLSAFNQKSSTEIAAFDFENWLTERGMQRFLSASRGNGLKAIVNTIRNQT